MQINNKMSTRKLLEIKGNINIELMVRFISEDLEPERKNRCHDSNEKFICFYCKGTKTCKAGKTKQNKQRYRCNDCKKTMISERNLLTFSSKKEMSSWFKFIESLLDGDSIKVSAEKANISRRTAFRWRHKVMYIMSKKMNKKVLSGVVTLDETLFSNKYKSRMINSVSTIKKRGMSNDKINVTCAIDDFDNAIIKVADTGRVTSATLINIYSGNIDQSATVVSDSLRSYHKLMSHLKVDWIKIPSKKKSLGSYTLEPINSLHALLKDFIYKYKGISVKYLQGYLALFEYQRKNRNHHRKSVLKYIILDIFSSSGHLKCTDIDCFKPIYL